MAEFIFSPSDIVFGRSFSDWVEEWWRWVLSFPMSDNPTYDKTGQLASLGQRRPVWFLAASTTEAIRRILIPKGAALLVPLLTSIASSPPYPRSGPNDLLSRVKQESDKMLELYLELDSERLHTEELSKFRLSTKVFRLKLRMDNILRLPPSDIEAVSEGYWVFTRPEFASPGNHRIFLRSTKNPQVVSLTCLLTINGLPPWWNGDNRGFR